MTSTAASGTLYRTPFHQYHVQQGAKMVEFVGWEMPMLYRSIIEEHRQVRTSGGMFDVSHMGRLTFEGRDARRFLDRVCTRQIFGMDDGQCRYSIVCNDRGGCRDDTLVYRLDEHRYLMVCNAANRTKLLEHFK
ncbi:MAG: glycine cleavage system aminomethyltransferase GcvT, partial [Planctomycetota bacterium]